MRPSRAVIYSIALLFAGSALAGCVRRDAVQQVQYAQQAYPQQGGVYMPAPGAVATSEPYTLDSGDRLRVTVFGQEGINNSYLVDASGHVNVALIGPVSARGLTSERLSHAIAARLRQGYIREPRVSVEVETYRPFYILGEVNAPGQYPYVAHMTVETAVAIAGGYSPRAEKGHAELTRHAAGVARQRVPMDMPVRPGDTINVAERWF